MYTFASNIFVVLIAFFKDFLCVSVCLLVYMCTVYVSGSQRRQKRISSTTVVTDVVNRADNQT